MSQTNQETLKTIYDAFSKGDVNTVMGNLSDDIVYHITGRSLVSGDYSGKGEVLQLFTKLMELSEGTFSLEVVDMFANEQRGVVLTMERAKRDGRGLENRAVHVWEMSDVKGTRFDGYHEEVWDEFWS
jgi:ketosteroid isomerase-like protein